MAQPGTFGDYDATSLITIICAALASYNAFELLLIVFTTFQSYHGLYFWSLLVASCAIIPYVIGMVIVYFDFSAGLPGMIVNNIGWICMVVAQSVVLYSRLGIVLGNQRSRILVFTKWMIIVDAIVFYTLATTTVFGMHYSENVRYSKGYIYTERFQMTGFCVQEFIISGLYIWKVLDILKAGERSHARRTLWQLFAINVIIVIMDVGLLVLEYLGLADIQIAFKALVYSCKLKMEFAILNKLVESSMTTKRNMSVSIAIDDDKVKYSTEHWPLTPTYIVPLSPAAAHQNSTRTGNTNHTHPGRQIIRRGSRTTANSDTDLLAVSPMIPGSPSVGSKRESSDSYHRMVKVISQKP